MIRKKVLPICLVAAVVIIGGVYKSYAPEGVIEEQAEPLETAIETAETGTVAETVNELNFDVDPADSKYYDLNSKNNGWGFKKDKNKAPDIPEKTVKIFEANNTYYLGKTDDKVLYLTFDEGYENGYTGKILDVLKEKQVPAAFFITGPYLKMQGELVDRMVNEGHVVGNHTVNHPNLAKSDLATVKAELKGLEDEFFRKYNKSMIFMRPPEGEYSEKMLAFVSDIGYKTMLWSFAYKDWDVNAQKGSDYAFEQVTPYLHNGAILLLHAVSSDNAGALGQIIDYAREQGYVFKSIEELK